MSRFFLTTLVACMLCGSAGAAEPVTVLGLPLGGKMKMPIRQCSPNELGSNVRTLCWVDAPDVVKGARSGMLSVPGSDRRPKWAAHATFNVWIERDGTLRSFTAWNSMPEQFSEISDSISSRFGRPQRESKRGSEIMAADWTTTEGNVRLLCASSTGCNATFTSAAAHAKHLKELAERATKDAARPKSP